MRRLVIALPLVLAACYGPTPGDRVETNGEESAVRVWHDEEHGVVCWIYKSGYAGGISCLPDREVVLQGDGS